jgi:flagellar motor switch protein FliN
MSQTVSPALLLEVGLRVSAELGRARMPMANAVGLPNGAIVELDRSHDEPIDLYVNGLHFGTGRLLITDGEWAVRIESVDGVPGADRRVADTAPIPIVDSSSSGQAAPVGAEE